MGWSSCFSRRRGLFFIIITTALIEYLLISELATLKLNTQLYWSAFHLIAPLNKSDNKIKSKAFNESTTGSIPAYATPNAIRVIKYERKCDRYPPYLGPVHVDKSYKHIKDVEKKYPQVSLGGLYTPKNCTARYKVAVIVPYRKRENQLAIFLNHMHPFLMKQQLEYGIYIIEQDGFSPFNRAKLFNVGFVESNRLKLGSSRWECFVFHDVDLLPTDGRNMYSCPRKSEPRHMPAKKLGIPFPKGEVYGGVSTMTLDQFVLVNGYSNNFWGWGAEVDDDEMLRRLQKVPGYRIARYKKSVARYATLSRRNASPDISREELQYFKKHANINDDKRDGLDTLNYSVVQIIQKPLHTLITVDIDKPDDDSETTTDSFTYSARGSPHAVI